MALQKNEMEVMADQFRSDLSLAESDPLNPFAFEIDGVILLAMTQITGFDEDLKEILIVDSASRWSAMSVPLDAAQDKWAIVYNDAHEKERQCASVMEEVWHILLGHRLTRIVKNAGVYSRTFETEEEHDAYFLAAASLVPRKAIDTFVSQKGDIVAFAKKYGVSKELVEYRIKRAGLWYTYRGRTVKPAPEISF